MSAADPTAPGYTANNAITLQRADPVVASVVTYVQAFPAGVFHHNVGVNAAGQSVYIGPWGAGPAGMVDGY